MELMICLRSMPPPRHANPAYDMLDCLCHETEQLNIALSDRHTHPYGVMTQKVMLDGWGEDLL